MSTGWKAELEKLKRQPIEERAKPQKKEQTYPLSNKRELRKLRKLIESQLMPVVDVFREEGRTETKRPHIHEYKNGYTLVLPVTEHVVKPIILKIQFEFHLTDQGYVLMVKRENDETTAFQEKIITLPVTEEKIRNEIRDILKERRKIILKISK
jgi:hypothetical protein